MICRFLILCSKLRLICAYFVKILEFPLFQVFLMDLQNSKNLFTEYRNSKIRKCLKTLGPQNLPVHSPDFFLLQDQNQELIENTLKPQCNGKFHSIGLDRLDGLFRIIVFEPQVLQIKLSPFVYTYSHLPTYISV